MSKRKFTIENNEGENLVCIETTPPKFVGKLPVVIMCHGFGYFKEEDGLFVAIADRLAGSGYAPYYFDFSGCGESDGDYSKTTLTKLINDLKSVYNTVSAFEYIDPQRVSLIGHSFGSNIVIGAQYMNLERMVLSGSFTNAFKVLSNIFDEFHEQGISRRMSTSERTRIMGPQFWKDLKQYNMEKLIANFNFPILFVHGAKDKIVPVKFMEPLLNAAKNTPKPIILNGSNHDLAPERELAYEAISTFFG